MDQFVIKRGPVGEAAFSPCGRYRYYLDVPVDPLFRNGRGCVLFVLANPSIASHETWDPTVRRCVGFAKAWRMSSVRVVNVHAFIATDPHDLYREGCRGTDVVGPENDAILEASASDLAFRPVIAAWGSFTPTRGFAVAARLLRHAPLWCLGTNKDGTPKHPLYLPKRSTLVPYDVPKIEAHDEA